MNNNYNETKGGLQNYIPFKRQIADDFRNHKITRDELIVYMWLRLNANQYGITVTNLTALRQDIIRNAKDNSYPNTLILSLKSKRFLYYEKRSGHRGSFDIHFADFILPNKTITSLEKFFKPTEVRGDTATEVREQSEPTQTIDTVSQSSEILNNYKKSMVSNFSINPEVRGCNNDNDNYKDNDLSTSFKVKTNLSEFKPKNPDEKWCLEIALQLEEPTIDYLLGVLKKYGINHLKDKWVILQNEISKGNKIRDKRKYFNYLVSSTQVLCKKEEKIIAEVTSVNEETNFSPNNNGLKRLRDEMKKITP